MKIALGCDHGGYELKEYIKTVIEKMGHECEDFGCYNLDSCDYPDFGAAAAKAVAEGKCEKGIVVCTSGIGISIAANKVHGVRCALVTNEFMAEMTKMHNDANIIALGGRVLEEAPASAAGVPWAWMLETTVRLDSDTPVWAL